MPGVFNGKATEYTEYIFKMGAYVSTQDPGGKEWRHPHSCLDKSQRHGR